MIVVLAFVVAHATLTIAETFQPTTKRKPAMTIVFRKAEVTFTALMGIRMV
jgi:hypothetical protein